MATLKVEIDDEALSGLEFKRDLHNEGKKEKLTTEEFLSLTLSEWSRHAETKRRKVVAESLVKAFHRASPKGQARMLEVSREFLTDTAS